MDKYHKIVFKKKKKTELIHHGILGMRWGIRRYRDSRTGRVIPGKYISESKAKRLRKEGGSTPTSKTTIGFTPMEILVATGTLLTFNLVSMGISKFKEHRATQKILKEIEDSKIKSFEEIQKTKGKKRIEEDAESTNPRYHEKGVAYKVNCTNAVMAYEFRRRGFDVEALPRTTGRPSGSSKIFYQGFRETTIIADSGNHKITMDQINTVMNTAASWGKNARGVAEIIYFSGEGHIVSIENDSKGKTIIVDPQDASFTPLEDMGELMCIKFGRVDNLKITEAALETIKNKQR